MTPNDVDNELSNPPAVWSAGARKVAPLARKWAAYFHVPPSYVMAICEIESAFRADAHNGYAASQGGAWGLMQVTKTTADTLVARLNLPALPDIALNEMGTDSTVRKKFVADAPAHRRLIWEKWTASDARCLLDGDLNVMLGTSYLARFAKEFGQDLGKIAAAYHNGGGFLRLFLAARDSKLPKRKFPDDMPPKGKLYVMKALAARKKYDDEDETPVTPGNP